MKIDLIKAKVLHHYETCMVSEDEANESELKEIKSIREASSIEELVSAVEEALGDLVGAHEFILRAIMEE